MVNLKTGSIESATQLSQLWLPAEPEFRIKAVTF